jgi:hypothetical protein
LNRRAKFSGHRTSAAAAGGAGRTAARLVIALTPPRVARRAPRYPINDLNTKSFFCSPGTPHGSLKIAKNLRVSVLFRRVKFLTRM